ncbi:MAG: KH domain-containing protein [Spirochaetia bacterium]|nr:KH domain-containing protein [Spirochaetia bacterium]
MLILETHAMNEKEALDLGSQFLEIEPEFIRISLQKKGSTGFLGFGSKTPSLFQIEAIEGKTPVDAVIKGVVTTILQKMGYKINFKKIEKLEDGKTYVEIVSNQAGYVIGKRGKTLESLQFLTNLLVQNFTKEPPKILLDLENYREKRANHLADIANKIANFVIKTGKSRLMDPLNPYERRIIHMTLQENELVKTESEGTGVHKRIRVFPSRTGTIQNDDSREVSEEEIKELEESLDSSIAEESEESIVEALESAESVENNS